MRKASLVLGYIAMATWATPFLQPNWLYTSSFLILINLLATTAVDAWTVHAHTTWSFWTLWILAAAATLAHTVPLANAIIVALDAAYIAAAVALVDRRVVLDYRY